MNTSSNPFTNIPEGCGSTDGRTIYNTNFGWECPKCGRCYAPHIIQCSWCGPNTVTAPYIPSPPWTVPPYGPLVTWNYSNASPQSEPQPAYNRQPDPNPGDFDLRSVGGC